MVVTGKVKTEEGEDTVDYKEESSFAKHILAQKNEAQSTFAKTKTIKEQRYS
jgi:hypothetical protein